MEYLINWMHHYLIHLGAWITFILASSVYKEGPPLSWAGIKTLVASAALIGALAAIPSSHSHLHYNTYLKEVIK